MCGLYTERWSYAIGWRMVISKIMPSKTGKIDKLVSIMAQLHQYSHIISQVSVVAERSALQSSRMSAVLFFTKRALNVQNVISIHVRFIFLLLLSRLVFSFYLGHLRISVYVTVRVTLAK